MDFSAPSRVRTATAAVGTSGCLMDFGASFQPSKRQKIASQDVEMRTENEPESFQPSNGSLLDRLMYEVTSGAASSACSWRLSSDRSIAQNESYLNEQLEHAALLSGGTEITPQLSRLRFTALLEELETNQSHNQPQPQQQLQSVVDQHVRHAMDIVSWLLVLRQQDLRQQETLMDRQRVITKDVDRKQNQLAQAALEIDALRQQLAQQENMFHAREQALVAERRALQQDKKHLEVLCAKLQGQETAFKAQLRRKDVEYERLKKSLQDAAQRSSKESRGLAMGKLLNGTNERRQTSTSQRCPSTQSAETLLNRRLIETLERKRDDLLFENDALARSFETLQKQVESVCVQYKKAVQLFLAQRGGDNDFDDEEDDRRTDETRELARVPIDDFTPMPLQLGVKANVAVFITETVDKLAQKVDLFERAMRSELEASMAKPQDDLAAVVDALKEKLEHAHAVIAEQDRLLQASLLTPSSSSLATGERGGKTTVAEHTSPEKENIHVNTGKHTQFQSQLQQGVTTNTRTGGNSERLRRRAPAHQVLLLEQWTDELSREWQEAKRKHKNLNDERSLLQRQAEKLDVDRLAFEQRTFTHFFGGGGGADDAPEREGEQEEEEGDIVMQDMDCPTTPRTAAYLRSIGIVPSVLDLTT